MAVNIWVYIGGISEGNDTHAMLPYIRVTYQSVRTYLNNNGIMKPK